MSEDMSLKKEEGDQKSMQTKPNKKHMGKTKKIQWKKEKKI